MFTIYSVDQVTTLQVYCYSYIIMQIATQNSQNSSTPVLCMHDRCYTTGAALTEIRCGIMSCDHMCGYVKCRSFSTREFVHQE